MRVARADAQAGCPQNVFALPHEGLQRLHTSQSHLIAMWEPCNVNQVDGRTEVSAAWVVIGRRTQQWPLRVVGHQIGDSSKLRAPIQ